mmetsp:Transcript_56177/g.111534  ORF Transcript_56177/g.111534 Transcript_56177/m.111534 type:complete len:271 (-) Transcript_56177:145-957(-)|eukprot:CAMPEP_0174735974 /NCGR_PEP_ID=MMETSP1094-20130205/65890_1 /TAXON_ID=156173 /ORGANISM="Chrysochromulina brevifilum, Strain UTEX LB 985" /LENGTH=270 /DNA_ID=CAMNT_0015939009 /DNA_START=65 /DNA_END=877 /DNA_ORIENTATION=+
MTLTVNLAKSMQAIAYIKRHGVFHNWNLASEYRGDNPDGRLEFGINLVTLLECLKIFGGGATVPNMFERSQSALHMHFRTSTASLCLMLNEKHSVTECEIHSLDIEMPKRIELNVPEGQRLPARLVVASDILKNGFDELEWGGDAGRDKRVALRICAHPGSLSLTVSSTDVGCEMVYPKEALVSFEATKDLAFEYRFQHMHMALRALKESQQTQLQLDEQGTLEIKMRFASNNASRSSELFSHFFIFPLAEEDDDEPPGFTASGLLGDDV